MHVSLALELATTNSVTLLLNLEHSLIRPHENEMKRSRLTKRDGSRPSDFDDPRPPKSARIDELYSTTSDGDGDSDSDIEEAPQAAAKKGCGRPKKSTKVDFESIDCDRLRPLLEVRKPLEDDDIDEVVGPAEPIFDAHWTQQDEEAMMLEWDSSPEKTAFSALRPDNGAVRSLWKACLRIFRCTPIHLLSPLMNLRFQPLLASKGGRDLSCMLPQNFCSLLAAVIVHPIWRGSAQRFAMALQYAVISRTDDRRPWKIAVQCHTLRKLSADINKVKGSNMPMSIHEMHTAVRERDYSVQDHSVLSDTLYQIGEMMIDTNFKRPRAPTGSTVHRGHQVYLVTTQDLQAVSKAIDKVGFGLLMPVDRTYEVFKAMRGNKEMPRSEQLREFHIRAGKQQLRLFAKATAKEKTRGAVSRFLSESEDDSSIDSEARTSKRHPLPTGLTSEASPDDDDETPVLSRPLPSARTTAPESELRPAVPQTSPPLRVSGTEVTRQSLPPGMEDRLKRVESQLARQHQELWEEVKKELAKRDEVIGDLQAEVDGLQDRMSNPHRTYGGSDYGFTTGRPADDWGSG